MDAFWAIALFVIISIVADKLEGSKKKKLPKQPKQPKNSAPKTDRPPLKIPPIFKPPQPEKRDDNMSVPPAEEKIPQYKPVNMPQPIAAVPVPAPAAVSMWETYKKGTGNEISPAAPALANQTPNIHTEVIMNAIMYAQILDPPKAYRYMSMRRRRR